MKIFHISSTIHPKKMVNQSFSQLVDYGAKDKDLIYVPILFEEEDTFTSSSQPAMQDANAPRKTPQKLGTKVLKGAGGLYAAVEVLPDMAKSAMDKASGLLDSTKDFANKSIDSISEIKTHYREKFPNEKQNNNENIHREEIDEFVANGGGSCGDTSVSDLSEVDEFSQFGGSSVDHPEIHETPESGHHGAENVDYGNIDDADYDY